MKAGVIACIVAAVLIGVSTGGVSISAHHSHVMFDMQRDVTYTGVVVSYLWRNPHVHIVIDVPEGPGVPTEMAGRWDIEGASTTIMTRQGWNRASYAVGDPITVVAHPMRDGAKGAELFYAILQDGTRRYQDIARPADDPAGS